MWIQVKVGLDLIERWAECKCACCLSVLCSHMHSQTDAHVHCPPLPVQQLAQHVLCRLPGMHCMHSHEQRGMIGRAAGHERQSMTTWFLPVSRVCCTGVLCPPPPPRSHPECARQASYDMLLFNLLEIRVQFVSKASGGMLLSALRDCQNCRVSGPYRDAQDRPLWRDKTCPAHN